MDTRKPQQVASLVDFKPVHAVHRLYAYRKSLSTKAFSARGKKLIRCPLCLLGTQFCTCAHRKPLSSDISVMLIMYDDEVLKPTNSGRLIADLIPDTHAYLWSRTQPNQAMLAQLVDPQYQVYLVFPEQYVEQQVVFNRIEKQAQQSDKKVLLVFLDGSWRQAIKMFRKSPYLHQLKVLSISSSKLATYALRKGSHDFQLGTAEVAALALDAAGEPLNGHALTAWFDLFVESSLLGRNRRLKSTIVPISEYVDQFNLAYNQAKSSNK
ncbi:tRNA-uridine aminocarboxypropyltransferase [Shewanella intestini]|uniref:tRNA-uridine aminocarboxypropyltransferase n=1 Tax=Shewanella intestini TaxID=2017544 RepID=A0ABS5HZJ5_9GAMM|nr:MULTISPECIES: DTW domain-containing protein [Shewanella]MBR9727196.1 DTW domain-containing protein [Shewanella intestini]MRG35998.1 DTW domain-containing protein [Shewanella sp. XMDDZSB0408]